jgi:hypothetical protein
MQELNVYYIFWSILTNSLLVQNGDGSLLRYVDTIQKFTQILMANVGRLLDLGSRERNGSKVNSRNLNLILDSRSTEVFYTVQQQYVHFVAQSSSKAARLRL